MSSSLIDERTFVECTILLLLIGVQPYSNFSFGCFTTASLFSSVPVSFIYCYKGSCTYEFMKHSIS